MAWTKEELAEHCRRIGTLYGGRKKGKKTKKQMHKEAVVEEYKQSVLRVADHLFEKQLHLANGQTYLWRIKKIKVAKSRWINGEPELVTDPNEMRMYLEDRAAAANGELDDLHDPGATYYFLTAKDPNNQAIDSMLDRAFGKARQVVGLEGATPGSAVNINVTDEQYARLLNDEFQRIAANPVFTDAVGITDVVGAGAESTDSEASGEGTADTV